MNPELRPVAVVGDVVFELQRLSGLLCVLSNLNSRHDSIDAEAVGCAMSVIWDCLDQQIKALDGIQWSSGGR